MSNTKNNEQDNERREPAVGYVHTSDFSDFMSSLGISLLVSTYQAQRIMMFSPNGERLFMLMRIFERPTGIAVSRGGMALVTRRQVWYFAVVRELRDAEGKPQPYDLYLVPRWSHVTGDILGHEIGFFKNELMLVNTRFSCLCTLSKDSSFVPIWKPRFVSSYAPDDRCHLNGLVIGESGAKFVTALGTSNEPQGWRKTKSTGGVIIDVPSGEIVSNGICMPHSPRWYRGKLWVLESGLGQLQTVDIESGKRTVVATLPGYLRGLAFYDRFAFVGLCQIREKENFGGLPIEEQIRDLKCAVYVIDLTSGSVQGFIQFTKGIEEIFDVHVLPGVNRPHVLGFEEDTIDGVFVLPE